jgi:hypothetical protein
MGRSFTIEERLTRASELGILVDDEDAWLLTATTWRIQMEYVATTIRFSERNKYVFLHHHIMGTPIYATDCIDHINRNKRDNRRSNLRWATYTENKLNSKRSDGAIHAYRTANGKYQARVVRYGVAHELGTYDTIEEAQHVRDQWLSIHGQFQVGDDRR